ncbi:MAG: hypothetical protein GVY31_14295 [Alphaproteobacteria bacterium]|nr:hypothetical protein [Alphaproteobacteria bacterium]
MFRSLGLATDALAMDGLSTFEDRGDHIVQTTPDEPDFWFGNCVILRDAGIAADRAEHLFRAAHPRAGHICLQWDCAEPDTRCFETRGYEVERDDVLTLRTAIKAPDLPTDLTLRSPQADADWQPLVAFGLQIGIEDGHDPVSYADYLAKRYANRRAQISRGLGQWFALWDRDLPVASMGVLMSRDLIRFQDVQTRASHRRRGLCAALLGHVGRWAFDRSPDAKAVIVAEADGDAGRIYRRAGFARHETVLSALKRPQ